MDEARSEIVAGIVDDETTAAAIAVQLERTGFASTDIDRFKLNQAGQHHALPLGGDEDADVGAEGGGGGALTGAGIGSAVGSVVGLAATPLLGPVGVVGGIAAGAYAGALAGAVSRMGDDADATTPPVRPPGVMVAVRTDATGGARVVIDIMREHGARFVERATGVWRGGRWSDFDPVAAPRDVVLVAKP